MAAMESKISSLPPLSAADQAEDRGDLDTASDHRCTVLAKLALRIAKDRQNDAASWDVLLTEPMLPGHCVWPHLNIRELHRLGRASASLQKSAMVALQALPRPVLFEESPCGRTFPIDWSTLKEAPPQVFMQRSDARVTNEDYQAACIVQPGNIIYASGSSEDLEAYCEREHEYNSDSDEGPEITYCEELLSMEYDDMDSKMMSAIIVQKPESELQDVMALSLDNGHVLKIGEDGIPRVASVSGESNPPSVSYRGESQLQVVANELRWKALAPMIHKRSVDCAIGLLPDHRVIVVGGDKGSHFTAEIYDLATDTWTELPLPDALTWGSAGSMMATSDQNALATEDPVLMVPVAFDEVASGVVLRDGRFLVLAKKGRFIAVYNPKTEIWECPPKVSKKFKTKMMPVNIAGNLVLFPSQPHRQYSAFLLENYSANCGTWIEMPLDIKCGPVVDVGIWKHQEKS